MDKKTKGNWLIRLTGGELKEYNMKKFSWILLLSLAGMAIMILSSFFDISEQVVPDENQMLIQDTSGFIEKNSTPKTMQDYEKLFENQLTEVLTSMIGVEEVTVKVNLDSTEELIIEKNKSFSEQTTKEKDKQGGSRDIRDVKKDEEVVLYRANNNEQPLIIKTLKPKIRGVVIVAKGAERIQVKAMITEAVQRLLDVPPHKIAILPGKN